MRTFLVHAVNPVVVSTALPVALVVGTLLNIINNGDALLSGNGLPGGKVLLNYAVPYLVATYSAIRVNHREEGEQ